MISDPKISRPIIGLAVVAFLTAALAVTAWLAVHSVLCERADEFRNRCLLHASSLASTFPPTTLIPAQRRG